MLNPSELNRYSRHLLLPEVGAAGQARLKAASALVIGLGGLGSPVALYLAAAGLGRLGLVEADQVSLSNLQRQVLYRTDQVGQSKIEVATAALKALNPEIHIESHSDFFHPSNALALVNRYEVIIDGTDNFATRYLVNDACVLAQKPLVHASVYRFEGQVSVFYPPQSPCYRCLFPTPPPPELVPSCADAGVLGVLPGLIGTLQANEVLKWILGIGKPLLGALLMVDALNLSFNTIRLPRDPACPICGDTPSQTQLLANYEAFCGVEVVPEISVEVFQEWRLSPHTFKLLDVREPHEFAQGNLGGALMPLNDLASFIPALQAENPEKILVHCQSGLRSAQAVKQLLNAGFKQVWHLKGGYKAWLESIKV